MASTALPTAASRRPEGSGGSCFLIGEAEGKLESGEFRNYLVIGGVFVGAVC
jgi:hypothetical protein